MKNKSILCLCISLLLIFFYSSATVKLTRQRSFSKNSQDIVQFYEDHWEDNFSSSINDRVFPSNPLDIPFTVYDAEHNFLAATRRDIRYELDHKEYEIQINGQYKGVVWIHYEEYFTILNERIQKHQIRIQQFSIFCLCLLTILPLARYVTAKNHKRIPPLPPEESE